MSYSSNHKKAFFLLLCSIFYYHEMEEREKNILLYFSDKLDGKEELEWACDFVKRDVLSTFKRSRAEATTLLANDTNSSKLDILNSIWLTTKDKGYITEIEADLLLGLAREWCVESELIRLVKEENS